MNYLPIQLTGRLAGSQKNFPRFFQLAAKLYF